MTANSVVTRQGTAIRLPLHYACVMPPSRAVLLYLRVVILQQLFIHDPVTLHLAKQLYAHILQCFHVMTTVNGPVEHLQAELAAQ